MSLAALAIRTCLRQALLGRTQAEDRVHDSVVTPLELLTADGVLPLIIVSTDDDEGELRQANRKLTLTKRGLQVVVELALASAVRVEAGGAVIEIPHTEEGLERVLDLTASRVWRVMKDPRSPWAELFRSFLGQPTKYFTRRGADDSKGVLFAARQIVVVTDPLEEPDFGVPVGDNTPWARFVARMRASDELAEFAEVFALEVEGGELEPWEVTQARLGINRATLTALGFGPLPAEGGAPEGTPAAQTVTLVQAGRPDRPVSFVDDDGH